MNILQSILIVYLVTDETLSVQAPIKVTRSSDPGSCNKKNEGKVVLAKNGDVGHVLLVCTVRSSVFNWYKLDGTVAVKGLSGTRFSPGYDCSDILSKNPLSKNGFYWITLGSSETPRKVWCDMTTDGGGFMLVGRMNSSVTWNVSSTNDSVEPFGFPHWASNLGDAPVLDFRIQMASKDNFKATKAHWFYRLQSSRKLKNLMVNNKGCGPNSPGIGDIAFVKNLLANQIVSRNFRCSKFGIGYHPRSKLGWVMMNSCLEKPCSLGFAFLGELQLDYSGSFSYSASGDTSGMEFGATAAIGCYNGNCCGCHGSKNGKLNYCLSNCKVSNGGENENTVFTWFWVRTSVTTTHKFWKKCFEYQVNEMNETVWYKLVGSNEIPIKGRCPQNQALIYNGLLAVPDNATAEKIPTIDGMLLYRKDQDKLYFMGAKKLNALAEEEKTTNKIKILSEKVNILEKEVKILNTTAWNSRRKNYGWSQSLKLLNKTVLRNENRLKKIVNILNSRFFTKLGTYQRPGRSCSDIKKWSNVTSSSDGEYWITLGNSAPIKVFCDMNSDGGGWTLVSSIVLQNSNGFDWSVTKHYEKISDYSGNKLVLSTRALDALRQKLPFKQLRFFCRKKVPGRTFDIATKTNTLGENVVKYFTAKTNTFPKSCGSYYRLSDDNSVMAKECANWGYESGKYLRGKWHHANMPIEDRLYNHPAFVYLKGLWFVSHSARGRWECDDFIHHRGYTRSAGDFWKVFVR